MKTPSVTIAAALTIGLSAGAQASIIPIGSAFTFHPTNAPDTYSDTTTFGGTVLVDGGAAQLTMSQTPTGGGGEWDVWTLTTSSGGPIAGNVNADWVITMDYVLSQNVFFDGVVNQWLVDGIPVSPINNFGGICCASATNPATGGEAYYNNSFSSPLSAGTETDWNQIFVNPYSFASSGGIDPSTANGFTWALHFTPQVAPTPEPGSLAVIVAALSGLGLAIRRRARA